MDTSQTGPGGPTGFWQPIYEEAKKPVCAGAAIIPNYWAWVHKSAQQMGKVAPQIGIRKALYRGAAEGAPAVTLIVGSQTIAQDVVERGLEHIMTPGTTKSQATSSLIVGATTSPLLAAYNGKSAGLGFWESIRRVNAKQVGAISTRETAFLFSLRGYGPIKEVFDRALGESRANGYLAAFTSGGIGSVVAHPADTLLTRWQNNMPIVTTTSTTPIVERVATCGRMLMWGWARKSLGTAGFAVTYRIAKEILGAN